MALCMGNHGKLIEFFDKVTKKIDEGRAVAIVYMGFSKAFDKILHGFCIFCLTEDFVGGHYQGTMGPRGSCGKPVGLSREVRKDVVKLERLQKRFTRMLPELEGLSYREKLNKRSSSSLECQRVRGDLIEVYKIMRGMDR
eukprot:g31942.t1